MNLSGGPFDFVIAFIGGVLVSFTPCVYPLIPISASYIGVRSSGSKVRGLILSLIFTTGVAVTYSILGLIASLTGTFFGRISTSPTAYFVFGAIIIVFGFSMLDLFVIPFPQLVKLPALKQRNYFSTFLLGLSSGLIASPCLTPVLGSILAYLTVKKNILYGATLLFCFAYGMGLTLILVGAFSSALLSLPRAGKWMRYIKRFCACLLIALRAYFIYNGIKRI